MNAKDYEKITSEIVQEIYKIVEGEKVEVGYGQRNKLRGVSGFLHQIDVSLRGVSDLLLVECKCWEDVVSLEAVLVFVSRVCDIRPTFSGEVYAYMITTKGFSKGGIDKIAKQYKINLCVASSPHDFAITYKKHRLCSVSEQIIFRDEVAVIRLCPKCKAEKVLYGDKYQCSVCDV